MRDACPCQIDLEEELALGVPREDWSADLRAHLEGCASCQAYLQEGLLLQQLLQEPLGLPPLDLTERILQAVRPAPVAQPLPIWERLGWAGLGALLTLAVQFASLDGLSSWWGWLAETSSVFTLPVLDWPLWPSSWTGASLLLALALQGLIVLRYRKEAL